MCLFLQQRFHRAHRGLLHEVALQAVVAQIIGQRGQYHALVVGIVGFHRHMVFLVVTLEESEFILHAQLTEALDVVVYGAVVDRDGHQRAVGRDDYAVGGGVLELQVGDAEGVVLVILGVVQFVVSRLADTPGQPLGVVADEGFLCTYGETIGFVHQRVSVSG